MRNTCFHLKKLLTVILTATIILNSFNDTFCGLEEEIVVSDDNVMAEKITGEETDNNTQNIEAEEAMETSSEEETIEKINISSEQVSMLDGRKATAYTTYDSDGLPTRYRATDYGWVTCYKPQAMGDCQSFAAIAAIETSILKNNITVEGKKVNKDTLDLSELYHYSLYDENNSASHYYGASFHPIWWKGPVTEEKAPYTGSRIDPQLFKSLIGSKACDVHVKDILQIKNDEKSIKRAIMENGSCYMGVPCIDHAVQAIGWDDEYIDESGFISTGSYWACKDSACGGKTQPLTENLMTRVSYSTSTIIACYIADDFDRYNNNTEPVPTRYSNKAGRNGICYTLPDNGSGKKEDFAGVILETQGSGTLDVYKVVDGERTLAATATYGLPDYAYKGYITVPLSQTVSVSPGEEIEIVINSSDNKFVDLERFLTKNTDETVRNQITLDAHELRLATNETAKLTATVSNGSETPVFRSYDETVAKVDSDGNITPVAVGETYIEAKTSGDVKYCEVIVKCYNGNIEMTVEDGDNQYYNGYEHTPEVKLTLNGVELVEGTDWELNSYKNNIFPGTASVKVELIGKYGTGSSTDYLTKEFPIKKMTLATVKDLILKQGGLKLNGNAYNPKNIYTSDFEVTGVNWNARASVILTAKAVNNTVGKQNFTVTVPANDYTEEGTFDEEGFTAEIRERCVSNSEVTITMDEEANDAMLFKQGEYIHFLGDNISHVPFLYTGKAVEPKVKEISVTVYGETYVIPEDEYTITYDNNVEANTEDNPAVMTITFKNYITEKELKKVFVIAKNPLDGIDLQDISNARIDNGRKFPFGNVPSLEKEEEWDVCMPRCVNGYLRYDVALQKDVDFTMEVDKTDPVFTEVKAYWERKNTPIGQNHGSAYSKVKIKGIGKYKGETTCLIDIEDFHYLRGKDDAYIDKEIEKLNVSVSDTTVVHHDDSGYNYTYDPPVVTISYNGYTYKTTDEDFPSCFYVSIQCDGEPGQRYTRVELHVDDPFYCSHNLIFKGKVTEVKEGETPDSENPTPEQPNPDDPPNPDTPAAPQEKGMVLLKGEKKKMTLDGSAASSNPSVVGVKVKKGTLTLTAKKAGTSDITLKTSAEQKVLHVTVEDVKLKTKKASVNKGESIPFPLTETSQEAEYRSSNESIVTVDENGNMTGVRKGTAKVTASIHGIRFTATVTVEEPAISASDLYLNVKKSKKLKITGTKGKAAWSVDDASVASVKNGTVKGLSCGRTTIHAVVNGKEFVCNVQVDNPVQQAKKLSLNKGDSISFPLTFTDTSLVPAYTVKGSCISVSESGVITGLSYGSATVTAEIGGYRYKVKVQVDDPVLSTDTMTLSVKKSGKLKLLQTKSKILWKSENPAVATVKNGTVKALSVGETVITASANGHSYECKVVVE